VVRELVEGLAFEALQSRTEAPLVLANDWQTLKTPH
jgi:hypothetical protein